MVTQQSQNLASHCPTAVVWRVPTMTKAATIANIGVVAKQ
jgi:hypothetical protein